MKTLKIIKKIIIIIKNIDTVSMEIINLDIIYNPWPKN